MGTGGLADLSKAIFSHCTVIEKSRSTPLVTGVLVANFKADIIIRAKSY
jgi:hypothetical protein